MSEKHILKMRRPAGWYGALWKEAIPLGDGITGAMVYGGVQKEILTLTRYDLWHWGDRTELPDVHETLKLARQLQDQGNYSAANSILSDTLIKRGYVNNPAVPFPLADLCISVGNQGVFCNYKRELDMKSAEARIEYEQNETHFKRRCMISRENGILFYEIRTDKPCKYIDIQFDFHEDGTNASQIMRREQDGFLIDEAQITETGGYLFWREKNGDKGDFGAVARIISDRQQQVVCENKIQCKEVQKILIMVYTFTGSSYEKSFEEGQQKLSNLQTDYLVYKEQHQKVHQSLYSSCDISFSDIHEESASCEQLLDQAYVDKATPELMEKLWHFGRYLFVSGTALNSGPFSLYGLWNGEYNPVWAQNVANENVQMIYWHIHTGGLNQLARPLIEYYCSMCPQMRENAKKLFGCRGIFLSTYTTPDNGYVSPIVPVITNWIGGAGWICQHFFQYYKCSNDEKLFQEKILPFMIEAARFYCDYIVYDENGRVKIYPSVSPENSPADFIPKEGVIHLGHAMPVVYNATMDFAIIKELLSNLLSVADRYPEVCLDVAEWKRVLKAIPPYQVNEEGAVKEWMTSELHDFYCHRHLSHLYPVFPGNEIACGDEPLWSAFEKAVDLRELGGQVGWSLMHMASIYARFGRGENCAECIDLLVKGVTLPNLMMLSNDYRNMGVTMDVGQFAPVQLDANLGYVNALQEMLFYETKRTLYLLPACPTRLVNGRVEKFCFTSGNITFSWNLDKKFLEAEIEFEQYGNWTLVLPTMMSQWIYYINGARNTEETFVDGKVQIAAVPGYKYRFNATGE